MAIDIHNFDRQLELAKRNLAASSVSARNKELITRFAETCLLRQVCGKVRLVRAIGALTLLATQLGKDFDHATREDLERLVSSLLQRTPAYSVETFATYKRILRRFLLYVRCPSEFPNVTTVPPDIAWIKTNIRRRDRPTVKRGDLLTPAEIDTLLRHTVYDRDRAFIAILWEAGPRIAEIGNMQIKHAVRTSYGYALEITGKTGPRTPLIVSSAPYLAQWLAVHPYRDDPEAPLWTQLRSKKAMTYATISVMLERLFRRAGVRKPFHPHIFRHSRVTYVLANGIMNEQQAKVYFGWAPDSDMPGSTYAHLIDADVNNAILRENNLAVHQQVQRELQPVKCTICGDLNPPRAEYCQRCRAVLNLTRAYEHQQLHDLKEDLFTSMFKLLVEKGLVDEAARQIHDAGLGMTLKRLAQHVSGEQPIAPVKEIAPPSTNTPGTM
jgi:integrase/ribosomal protein L40E